MDYYKLKLLKNLIFRIIIFSLKIKKIGKLAKEY
jgi:hypothetical protein